MLTLCSISSLIFLPLKGVCSSNTRWASLLVVEKLVKRGFFGYFIFLLQATWQVQVCQCCKKNIYVYTLTYFESIYVDVSYFYCCCCVVLCVVSIYSTVRTAVPRCLFPYHRTTMSIGKLA